mgnify:CR=1 FL=1
MSGIDYGMGMTNIDHKTGIRYGVIQLNHLAGESFEEIISNGDNLDYMEWKQEKIDAIKQAIAGCFEGEISIEEIDGEAILDSLEIEYPESPGDCPRYRYEQEGYILETDFSGDVFVIKSPYVASRGFCSPCAPGACHLKTKGEILCYCLGEDWFDEFNPCPYEILPAPQSQETDGNHKGENS